MLVTINYNIEILFKRLKFLWNLWNGIHARFLKRLEKKGKSYKLILLKALCVILNIMTKKSLTYTFSLFSLKLDSQETNWIEKSLQN